MFRSIRQAVDIIHLRDPDSAITIHTIRIWCKEGKVRTLQAGNKTLVDMNSLFTYIGN